MTILLFTTMLVSNVEYRVGVEDFQILHISTVRYEAAQKDGHEITLIMEGHKALKAAQQHIKKTDPEAEILQWKKSAERIVVNNTEALTPKESITYIGLPYNRKHLGMGRVEIGIRIATNNILMQVEGTERKESLDVHESRGNAWLT